MAKKAKVATVATPEVHSPRWVSRIVGHDRVRADQLLANPYNHRRHPQKQRDVVAASIRELGFVKSVLVNRTTGHIVDGHERAMQALGEGDGTLVDVEYVELSEEEERKALLILDASSELAMVDSVALEMLLDGMGTNELALEKFIQEMALKANLKDSPEDFAEVDENIEVNCQCPKCGYQWSDGK